MVPAMTPHLTPSPLLFLFTPPLPCTATQDPGPQPLELKEVFRLFQMQYNRSYPNPAGIPGHVHLQSNPCSHLTDKEIQAQGGECI